MADLSNFLITNAYEFPVTTDINGLHVKISGVGEVFCMLNIVANGDVKNGILLH